MRDIGRKTLMKDKGPTLRRRKTYIRYVIRLGGQSPLGWTVTLGRVPTRGETCSLPLLMNEETPRNIKVTKRQPRVLF